MPEADSQLQVTPRRRHQLLHITHRPNVLPAASKMLLQVLGWMLWAHTGTFPKLQHKLRIL